MRSLLLAMIIASCVVKRQPSNSTSTILVDKPKKTEIEYLKDEIHQLHYYINHEKCFISYSICLSEGKRKREACWANHERCVVNTYRYWMETKNK